MLTHKLAQSPLLNPPLFLKASYRLVGRYPTAGFIESFISTIPSQHKSPPLLYYNVYRKVQQFSCMTAADNKLKNLNNTNKEPGAQRHYWPIWRLLPPDPATQNAFQHGSSVSLATE